MTYRQSPTPYVFVVEARVQGPLGAFQMEVVVEAWDAGDAIVRFVQKATEDGFDLLGEPRISKRYGWKT